jgi:hypothetical protein
MSLSGPGTFNLAQARALPDAAERLAFLESQTAQGALDLPNALEIGRQVGLPEASLAELERFGRLMGQAPLFAPPFAPHRDNTRPTTLGFALRLRALMAQPEAETTQAAVKRVVERHRGTLQALGPRERDEWGQIVRLARREVGSPMALEAGLEGTLSLLSALDARRQADPHGTQTPLDALQDERRRFILSRLEQGEYDALYRYTRDNAINAPLRRHFGLGNVPDHVLAEPRPSLAAEPLRRGRTFYQPKNGISTGEFISALDRGLASLEALQGRDHRTLYRATLFRRPWVEAMAESGRFEDHGFISTSRHPDKLEGFFRNEWSTRFEDEVPVLMVFETARGVDVSCLSRFTNESEHVIPRGQSFHAEFLGHRRDLCPDVAVTDEDDWAIFIMTDDGAPPSPSARLAAETVARRPAP